MNHLSKISLETEERGNTHLSPEELTSEKWENTIEKLIENSDVWGLSVADLAQNYRLTISRVGEENLELPGRMLVVCSRVLKTKADELSGRNNGDSSNGDGPELGGENFFDYAEFAEESFVPSLELPVKRNHQRIIAKEELKQARESAIDVYESRRKGGEGEEEDDDRQWLEMNFTGKDIRSRLNSLWKKIKDKLKQGTGVIFSELLDEEEDQEEKLEKFIHLLHLQSEGKISCKQEQPFGHIEIQQKDEG